MALFLGIDGGGTGCRAAVADAQGRVLGRGTGGPANINTDVDAAAASIMDATTQALKASGATPGADTRNLIAVLGLAGGTMRAATQRLSQLLPFGRMQIVNDAVTATRGALGAHDGILAAIGTGSVFAVQRSGAIRQVGGRGFLLGDEGSGAVLGRSLMAMALRAGDGFTPMTPLLRRILDDHGGIEGIIAFGNRARPADFGALAPDIVVGTDPAAQVIFDTAIADLRHILTVLQGGAAQSVELEDAGLQGEPLSGSGAMLGGGAIPDGTVPPATLPDAGALQGAALKNAASPPDGTPLSTTPHLPTALLPTALLPVVFTGGLGAHYAARLAGPWPVRAPLGDGVAGALIMARQMGDVAP